LARRAIGRRKIRQTEVETLNGSNRDELGGARPAGSPAVLRRDASPHRHTPQHVDLCLTALDGVFVESGQNVSVEADRDGCFSGR
jgi:hypothetical protein